MIPTPLQIARIQFVQAWMSKNGRGLFREGIYGIDIEVELMMMLKQWEYELEDMNDD